MLLKEFVISSAIYETKNLIRDSLYESINDYLSMTSAQLKTKKPQDVFKEGDPKAVDLDHLALIVTGLKIISNPDYRAGITKRDVGVNVNDAKELFNLLNQVDKFGKDQPAIANVFKALCNLAKPALKKQREELEILKVGDDAQRKHTIQELDKLISKASQMFNKIKTSANSTRGVDIASLGDL